MQEVATPQPSPGGPLIAVMASAIDCNTVWPSIFEPVPTFGFLERYGCLSEQPGATTCRTTYWARTWRVVLRTGPGVHRWHPPGTGSPAHCLSVELESSDGHDDTMLHPEQRIGGLEANLGGLAELATARS